MFINSSLTCHPACDISKQAKALKLGKLPFADPCRELNIFNYI